MSEEPPFDLSAFARQQRDRLPEIVTQIENVVRSADPIELLSHLTILHQTAPDGTSGDRDDKARWQTKIEWLTWLVFARRIATPECPAVLDGRFLDHLEPMLDEYFRAVAFSLMDRDPNLDPERDELRRQIQTEALFVRGLGYRDEIESLAIDLYEPHDAWCQANLGLRVRDAFALARILWHLIAERLEDVRSRARELQSELEQDPDSAVKRADEFPKAIREALTGGLVELVSPQLAKTLSTAWLFFRAPEVISVTERELSDSCAGRISAARVAAFVSLLGTTTDKISGEPSAIELNPLAFAPLLESCGRYYLFVPARLFEAIHYAFHTRLFSDVSYRTTYDKTRGEWLETSAVGALRTRFPNAEWGHGLLYGPKKSRRELDGMLLYDNKAILIECKTKSPTLAALAGDVPAILSDLAKAVLQPFEQAKRARDFIRSAKSVEFEERATGRRINLCSAAVSEIYLVTLVGSGAWASIAANLPRLAPLGMFGEGEYPWALSLSDLRIVTESMELPSQLFDYLKRRDSIQRDGRFVLHDEWDFLGVYLAGHLSPDDANFADASDVHRITLDGFDNELQQYYFAISVGQAPVPPRPRRQIPSKLLELLRDIELSAVEGRSDAIMALLGWPDSGLNALEEKLIDIRRKAIWDGRPHAATVCAPDRSLGIALAYASRDREGLRKILEHAVSISGNERDVTSWVGIGCNLGTPESPIVLMRP
jgi:hypothetical protein